MNRDVPYQITAPKRSRCHAVEALDSCRGDRRAEEPCGSTPARFLEHHSKLS
jgi:hypothetical protein